MRKTVTIFLILSCTLLSSCGGGGPVAVAQQIASTVSRSILMGCLAVPTSLDELLLGCLADKVSLGKDAAGNECKVGFSTDRLNILAKDVARDVTYQHLTNTGVKDTTYVYDRSYSSDTGALYFAATASNKGVPYFGFSFSTNTINGGGTAQFEFKLTPDIPGAPGVRLQCTMQL